ncbi:beta-fructofuranosidase [Cryobacterium sp. MP_M5]|uniref:glycosyl hydrolase family 32 n=1 Tax=unclassified Cryobacterium TaxID=2649013 RepID=UPI0018CAFE0E|nr:MULTISPECIES: glycosyl hydrolase family 32 [unclassified Cryobacterium]MBG6059037.1 beta-fructofuranosidase [Cryobacterium sp. MP_M3]MEC5177331.1 beta-fructofuranosidase [Cryobacterium sp. MP_M5]
MIERDGFWVWDSWYVEHAGSYHAFYLMAPTSLGDADLRHANARIGHSVSPDLREWTALADALGPGADGDFDDLGVWTGSIVRAAGEWHLFYTGVEKRSRTRIQRIGHAVSPDLVTWERVSTEPVATADARWYSTAAEPPEFDEPWRDPWVFRAGDGRWHMLITAREPRVDGQVHGSIGHCVSDDLQQWEVAAPLSHRSGFRQAEVIQVLEVAGRHVLVFCAAASDVIAAGVSARTATYTAPADGPLGPFRFDLAEPIAAPGVYAGRVLRDPAGAPVLLGFTLADADGAFGGVICDPIVLALTAQGTLQPKPGTNPESRSEAWG